MARYQPLKKMIQRVLTKMVDVIDVNDSHSSEFVPPAETDFEGIVELMQPNFISKSLHRILRFLEGDGLETIITNLTKYELAFLKNLITRPERMDCALFDLSSRMVGRKILMALSKHKNVFKCHLHVEPCSARRSRLLFKKEYIDQSEGRHSPLFVTRNVFEGFPDVCNIDNKDNPNEAIIVDTISDDELPEEVPILRRSVIDQPTLVDTENTIIVNDDSNDITECNVGDTNGQKEHNKQNPAEKLLGSINSVQIQKCNDYVQTESVMNNRRLMKRMIEFSGRKHDKLIKWLPEDTVESESTCTEYRPQGQRNLIVPATKMKLLEGFAKPVESDKASRMMRRMGWRGGALGRRGDGITEPLAPRLTNTPGAGFGYAEFVLPQDCSTIVGSSSKRQKLTPLGTQLRKKSPIYGERLIDFRLNLLKNVLVLLLGERNGRIVELIHPIINCEMGQVQDILKNLNGRKKVGTSSDEEDQLVREILDEMERHQTLCIKHDFEGVRKIMLTKVFYANKFTNNVKVDVVIDDWQNVKIGHWDNVHFGEESIVINDSDSDVESKVDNDNDNESVYNRVKSKTPSDTKKSLDKNTFVVNLDKNSDSEKINNRVKSTTPSDAQKFDNSDKNSDSEKRNDMVKSKTLSDAKKCLDQNTLVINSNKNSDSEKRNNGVKSTTPSDVQKCLDKNTFVVNSDKNSDSEKINNGVKSKTPPDAQKCLDQNTSVVNSDKNSDSEKINNRVKSTTPSDAQECLDQNTLVVNSDKNSDGEKRNDMVKSKTLSDAKKCLDKDTTVFNSDKNSDGDRIATEGVINCEKEVKNATEQEKQCNIMVSRRLNDVAKSIDILLHKVKLQLDSEHAGEVSSTSNAVDKVDEQDDDLPINYLQMLVERRYRKIFVPYDKMFPSNYCCDRDVDLRDILSARERKYYYKPHIWDDKIVVTLNNAEENHIKRIRSESSSMDEIFHKRTKIIHSSCEDLAIVLHTYPDNKIDERLAELIQKVILEKIYEINDTFLPKLHCLGIKNGLMIYRPENDYSASWLAQAVINVKVGNYYLKTITYKQIINKNDCKLKVLMTINSYITEDVKKLFERLEFCNSDIVTDRWVVRNETKTDDGALYVIEVDGESYRSICDLKFSVNAGIDQAKFTLLDII